MATRVCPNCGSQYVASVRRCIDCDVMLVDEVGPGGEEAVPTVATPLGEGDQIAYELDGWGNQLRVTLSGMLDLAKIPHVWEIGALVVAAPHEEAVDELIAAVEGGEAEELPADVAQVAFEIEEVSADELAALDAELIAAHIPHAWQETGELLVPEESEEAVATIIDNVLNPEEQTEEDGLATHAALDRLYVAVDKLGKAPTDDKLVARYVDAADGLDGLGVPYGMSGHEWDELLTQVAQLRSVLAGPIDPEAATDAVAVADADTGHEAEDDGADDIDGEGDGRAADLLDDDDEAEVEVEGPGEDDGAAVVDRAVLAGQLVHQLRTRMLDLV
ncbi:hypothetical protein [Aquihabitans sp. McL0605]|uniref:hypothetical protein n=1 Tax=Aquihabitans sp. McL0605 TaxID=3415671 RepID=UPI003CF74EEE